MVPRRGRHTSKIIVTLQVLIKARKLERGPESGPSPGVII